LPVAKIHQVTAGIHDHAEAKDLPGVSDVPFYFEPDEETVLGELLPHCLNFKIYQILLEAKASEHSVRMVAMKNATDNANQLIKDLTLQYNKLRQSNITKELLEIATAQMAVG
jgi:F-type H+-transporting ATPase subunit gamma